MAYTANLLLQVQARNTLTPENGTQVKTLIDHPYGAAKTELANGTGANQIDLAWSSTTTYNTTGTTHDLTALTSANTNTGAATFSSVKAFKVKNNSNTDTLVVGAAASNCFNPGLSTNTVTVTIQPGGEWVLVNPSAAGWTTTSANNWKFAAGANTVNTTVIILGED